MDNLLVLLASPESAHSFREFESSKHPSINLGIEHEELRSLLFSNVKLCLKNDKFLTSEYRKPTSSGGFSSYESQHTEKR